MREDILKLVEALAPKYPGLMNLDPVIVALMACRDFNQLCCTWRAWHDPVKFCPFCPTELERRGRAAVWTSGRMMVLSNEFPRKDATMWLIVPRFHAIHRRDLAEQDILDQWRLEDYCAEKHGFESGGSVRRFGDPRYHAGTIEHLHWNLIKPVPEMGMSAPLAKRPEGEYGHIEDYRRFAHDFWPRIVARGGLEWLFSNEGVRETQPPMMGAA